MNLLLEFWAQEKAKCPKTIFGDKGINKNTSNLQLKYYFLKKGQGKAKKSCEKNSGQWCHSMN